MLDVKLYLWKRGNLLPVLSVQSRARTDKVASILGLYGFR